MSYLDAVNRIVQLESAAGLAVATAPVQASAVSTASPFAATLARTLNGAGTDLGTAGARTLAVAEGEVGTTEVPSGSNDGPRIADYRSAVAGAAAGEPWCAYFVSWAAAQAGTPLGDSGQGLGSVAAITDWATRTGRLVPAGAAPQPGDLVLFGDAHVGIVESVGADGTLTTVEGNHGQGVERVTRRADEPTGFVRLG